VFNKPVKLSLQNGGHMGFTYDENDNIGNLVEIIDPSGVSTTATFDVMQNTTSVTDHNDSTVYFEYDKYKRMVKTTD